MTILNTYIVYLKSGGTMMISASNMSGAKSQMRLMAQYVDHIERVYKKDGEPNV